MSEVGVTLKEAIREKYDLNLKENDDATSENDRIIKESALGYRPGSCPIQHLSTVMLEGKGVGEVGDVGELAELCPRVQELHLPFNRITHSKDVCKIFSLPCLRFCDLSHNPLDSSSFISNGSACTHLSTLVLNDTGIGWGALEICLLGIPQLQELHLSINNYTHVSLSEAFSHPNLQLLHVNENHIGEWLELAKLSRAFPNLLTLIACGNPIHTIPELGPDSFPSLRRLNLTSSALFTWPSIEHLRSLCKLEELSVLKIPLGVEMKEKQRRQALIARLPRISKLNKSVVTESEREVSERWLIRDMAGKVDRPAIYQDLVKKHGQLNPLADVNLKPPETVRLEFHFDDEERDMVEKSVKINQSLWDFKTWVAKTLLGMPVSSFRLLHQWKDASGVVLLKYNQKFLYSYRFADGDEIHIEMK